MDNNEYHYNKLSNTTKYKMFITRLVADITDIADNVFDYTTDPEVSWKEFRKQLKSLKEEQIEAYLKTLEDDDETVYPESEITKWRKENGHYDKTK